MAYAHQNGLQGGLEPGLPVSFRRGGKSPGRGAAGKRRRVLSAGSLSNRLLAGTADVLHCRPRTRERREEDGGDGDTFARQAAMRLSVVTFMRPGTEPRGRPLGRIVDYARQIEKRGFPGIWVTDSLGRGRPTLDPLVALGALSVATQRVELGTAVLQVSCLLYTSPSPRD